MLRDLLLDGVDQDESAAGKVALVGRGINPDGEKLGAEVSLFSGFEIPVAAVERIAEVVVLVDEALGCVGVRVDDDGGALDLFGSKILLSSLRELRVQFVRTT